MNLVGAAIAFALALVLWKAHSTAFFLTTTSSRSTAFSLSSPYVSSLYGSHFILLAVPALSLAFVQQLLAGVAALTGLGVADGLAGMLVRISALLSVVVALTYGYIRTINVPLLLNPKPDFVLPLSLELQLYLWPAVFQALTAIFSPPRRWRAMTLVPSFFYVVIAHVYWFWYHRCASINRFLPYFRRNSPLVEVALLTSTSMVLTIGLSIGLMLLVERSESKSKSDDVDIPCESKSKSDDVDIPSQGAPLTALAQ